MAREEPRRHRRVRERSSAARLESAYRHGIHSMSESAVHGGQALFVTEPLEHREGLLELGPKRSSPARSMSM